MNEFYKFLAPVSILIVVLATAVMLIRWRGDNSMSMSMHAALDRRAYLMFAVALSLGGLLFYIFEIKWLVSHLNLSAAFVTFASLGLVLQLIAAWVPDVPGLKRRIHRPSAYTMAAIMGILLVFLAVAPAISTMALMVSMIALAIMAMVFGIFMIGSVSQLFSSAKSNYLIFQGSYVAVFFVAVLTVAYF
ncbi:MAG: hypothetical protein ABI220_01090 [Candidatus Saccharimonadales bacterium]